MASSSLAVANFLPNPNDDGFQDVPNNIQLELNNLSRQYKQGVLRLGTLHNIPVELLKSCAAKKLADVHSIAPRSRNAFNTFKSRKTQENAIPSPEMTKARGLGSKWCAEQWRSMSAIDKRPYQIPSDEEIDRLGSCPTLRHATEEEEPEAVLNYEKRRRRAKKMFYRSMTAKVDEAEKLGLELLSWIVDPSIGTNHSDISNSLFGETHHTAGATGYKTILTEAGIGLETFHAMAKGAKSIEDARMAPAFLSFVGGHDSLSSLLKHGHRAGTSTIGANGTSGYNDEAGPSSANTIVGDGAHTSEPSTQHNALHMPEQGNQLASPPVTPSTPKSSRDRTREAFTSTVTSLFSQHLDEPSAVTRLPCVGDRWDRFMRLHDLDLVVSPGSHGITERDISHRYEWIWKAGAIQKCRLIMSLVQRGEIYVRAREGTPCPQ